MLERVRGGLHRSWRRVLVIALAVYLVGPELVIAERTRVLPEELFQEGPTNPLRKEVYFGLYTRHPALRVFEWRPGEVQGFGLCEDLAFRCR